MPEQKLTIEDETELMIRVGQGDKSAFGTLYDRLAPPLYSLVIRILHDPAEAQDLLQEVFTDLWINADSYDSTRSRLFTWAVTLTRHKAIDRLRMRNRRARILDRSALDIRQSSLAQLPPDIRSNTWNEERRLLLKDAVAQLSDEQRWPLELAFFEGLTQSEIADRLQKPLGTVKTRIRRGLLRLRDVVAAKL